MNGIDAGEEDDQPAVKDSIKVSEAKKSRRGAADVVAAPIANGVDGRETVPIDLNFPKQIL